jgi:hypothetical protein
VHVCLLLRNSSVSVTTGLSSFDGDDVNLRRDTRKRPLAGVLLWDKQRTIVFLYFLNIIMELDASVVW